MSTEYGFIILRDVPKEEARIDVVLKVLQSKVLSMHKRSLSP